MVLPKSYLLTTLLLICAITTPFTTLTLSEHNNTSQGVIIIPIPNTERAKLALLINDTVVMSFEYLDSRSYVRLISVPSIDKRVATISDFKVLFNYSLLGRHTIVFKSSTRKPDYVLSASPIGEVVLYNMSGTKISIYRLRFHGAATLRNAAISSQGIAFVLLGNSLRVLEYGTPGWCEIGPIVGNLLKHRVEGYIIKDFVIAHKPNSVKGLEATSVIAITYIPTPIPSDEATLLRVKVLLNGTAVKNAIVVVRFDNMTLKDITNADGEATFVLPKGIKKLFVEAYYVAESQQGAVYYASKFINKTLVEKSNYVILTLHRADVVVPSIVTPITIALINITSVNTCREDFYKPLFVIRLTNITKSSVKPLSLLISKHLAYLVLSYSSLSPLGSTVTNIDIVVIDLAKRQIVSHRWYRLSSQPLLTVFSDDGRLFAFTTTNNILYLVSMENPLEPQIVSSYKLPQTSTSLTVLSRTGRFGDKYTIIVSGKGYLLILMYDPKTKTLLPINRGSDIALTLPGNVVVDALPQASAMVFATARGIYYVRNLGKHIDSMLGVDLSEYVARTLSIVVESRSSNSTHYTISLSYDHSMLVANNTKLLHIPYIAHGSYRIVVTPHTPLIPKLIMSLIIKPRSILLIPQLYVANMLENTSKALHMSVNLLVGNKSLPLYRNTTRPIISLSYNANITILLKPLPIRMSVSNQTFRMPIYEPSYINVLTNMTSIYISIDLGARYKARRVEVCLHPQNLRNASIGLIGMSTGVNYVLTYNRTSLCYSATGVIYDVYKLQFISLPQFIEIPSRAIYIVVDNPSISTTIHLRYKPVRVLLHLTPPPSTELEISLGRKTVVVQPNTTTIEFSDIAPGTYVLKVTSRPLRTPYGNITLYKPIIKYVHIAKARTIHLNITLIPQYKRVKLQFRDEFLDSSIIDSIILYINNRKLLTIPPSNASRGVELYLPNERVTLIISSEHGVYRTLRKEIDFKELNELTITLKRNLIDIIIQSFNNLGEKLDGVTITIYCNGVAIGSAITHNGIAKLKAPTMSSCYLKASMTGYNTVEKLFNTGVQRMTLSIVLQAQPLTIVIKYLPAIVASAIVASIVVIVIYVKRRVLQSLQASSEEYI